MDFVRRILQMFEGKSEVEAQQLYSFFYELKNTHTEYIITIHALDNECIVFCVISPEQWSMITDICELTGRDVESVVKELSENNEIMSIVVDTRDDF